MDFGNVLTVMMWMNVWKYAGERDRKTKTPKLTIVASRIEAVRAALRRQDRPRAVYPHRPARYIGGLLLLYLTSSASRSSF